MTLTSNIAIRDGGKTSEDGFQRLLNKIAGGTNSGIIGSGDLLVTQNGTPDMTVLIATGDIVIPYLDHLFHGWCTAGNSVAINSNSSGNPRYTTVVAYEDLTVVSSANSNNPSAMVFMAVDGSPAGSPSVPSDVVIQAAIGAGNPFVRLAEVYVANGATSIITANITDVRPIFKLFGLLNLPVVYNEFDNGSSGASVTIDWTKGDRQKVTLNANAVTVAYSGARAGQTLRLRLIQDGSGSRVPTLPGGTKWPYGAPIPFSTGIAAIDEIIVDYDGASYLTQAAIGFA
jgi:hypothetical protein